MKILLLSFVLLKYPALPQPTAKMDGKELFKHLAGNE